MLFLFVCLKLGMWTIAVSPRVTRAKGNNERSDGRDCSVEMEKREPLAVLGARGCWVRGAPQQRFSGWF